MEKEILQQTLFPDTPKTQHVEYSELPLTFLNAIQAKDKHLIYSCTAAVQLACLISSVDAQKLLNHLTCMQCMLHTCTDTQLHVPKQNLTNNLQAFGLNDFVLIVSF